MNDDNGMNNLMICRERTHLLAILLMIAVVIFVVIVLACKVIL